MNTIMVNICLYAISKSAEMELRFNCLFTLMNIIIAFVAVAAARYANNIY